MAGAAGLLRLRSDGAQDGFSMCRECRSYYREREQRRRIERAEAGRCMTCGRAKRTKKLVCRDCTLRIADNQRKRREAE
jgi:hypothetical protein